MKTMLQRSIDKNCSNWHNQLYSAFWAYCTTIKTVMRFAPFHLVHVIEVVLPIKCEIPILRSVFDLLPDTTPLEKCILLLECLDEEQRVSLQHDEAMKQHSKTAYDQRVRPRTFHEGDLALAYHTAKSKLGPRKFKPYWHSPFIIRKCLPKAHMSSPSQKAVFLTTQSMGCTRRNFIHEPPPSYDHVLHSPMYIYVSFCYILLYVFHIYSCTSCLPCRSCWPPISLVSPMASVATHKT